MPKIIFHFVTKTIGALLLLWTLLWAPFMADVLVRLWINIEYLGEGLYRIGPFLVRYVFFFTLGIAFIFLGLPQRFLKKALLFLAIFAAINIAYGVAGRAVFEKKDADLSQRSGDVLTMSDIDLMAAFKQAISEYSKPNISYHDVVYIKTMIGQIDSRNLTGKKEAFLEAGNSFREPRIRMAAIEKLEKAQVSQILRPIIFSANTLPAERIAALNTYRDVYKKESLPVILEAYENEQNDEVLGHIDYLLRAYFMKHPDLLKSSGASGIILKRLDEFKNKKFYIGLLETLAPLNDPEAWPYLMNFVQTNPIHEHRRSGIELLSQTGNPDALPVLKSIRQDVMKAPSADQGWKLRNVDEAIERLEKKLAE